MLSKSARTKDNFALVLGAGISIEPGAKTWDQLMQHMFNNILTKGLIKDNQELIDMDHEDLALTLMGISSFLGLKGMINNETKLTQDEIEETAESVMKILKSGIFSK